MELLTIMWHRFIFQLIFYVFSAAVHYCKGRYTNTSLSLTVTVIWQDRHAIDEEAIDEEL